MRPMQLSLFASLALLTACETMEGLGRDTEKAGQELEKSAQTSDGNPNDDYVAE